MVPANATSAGFTVTVSPVAIAQVVTLKAVVGSVSNSYALQLNAAGATLSVNATSVAFNSVTVNTAATQSVTLTSTGIAPLTVSAATVTGTGFTVSGASFPVTLTAGQTATLSVQFDPTAAGAEIGQLTIASNSSTGATTVIGLGGTGTAALSALTCNSGRMTAAGTVACAVTLNAAAPASGLVISLSSGNTAVTVPATVAVPPNTASAGFMATVLPVATAQVVTLRAAADSTSQTFTLLLNAAAPTLSVATSGSPSTYGDAVTFTATISSGPTGIVTFYDGDASIGTGTIGGTTTLTTSSLSVGSHTITASWPGNSNYSAVTSGAITQVVNKATPTIRWTTPAAITYGTALSATQLDASSTVAGTFAYTPAAGTVPKAGAQTLSVTFTPTDTTDYKAATATVPLTVNAATPTTPAISWTTPAAITYGTALSGTQLDASSTVAGTFAYTPAAGTVPKAGAQTLSVTFTPTDTTDYKAATATVTLTVNQATPIISWTAPAAITYGTALSGTQLDASSTIPGAFVYSPAAGTVLAVGSRTLSVTFTPTDTTDYKAATATVTLTVNAATPTTPAISWTTPAAITYGTALSGTQLDASSTVAGTFAYTPAAGTVPKAGAQTLSVTFTPTDTTDYKAATATVTLTVNQATPAISWTTPAAITYGTALSATQLDASSTVAGTFAYTPAAGTVPKAGAQTLSVTFTPTDTTDYKAATATVTLTVNAATPTTPAISWTTPAAITYGTALSGTQLDASSTVAGTFAYTPAAGTVPKAGAQTLSVTFTPTDTTDYKAATATVTLTVNQATPAISWTTPAAITYGTALSGTQLDASSTIPGAFVYSPAAGTVLAVGSRTLSVTFTPTDTADYKVATATVTLTVNAATATTPAISWTTPAAITYGTALSGTQLDASSTVAGTFAYTPAAGTVPKAGAQTLSVTFTPTDTTDYKAATATVTLTVNQATPAISWTTPAAIIYGTALSGTQLDASSTIPGAFVYSPAAGTVLAVGSRTLSVTFTPTDTADYTTATQTVTLTINQGTSTLSINATTVAFGPVTLNTPATQTVTLSSTGTASVTVNSVVLTGTAFTLTGPTFPATLTPGQTAILDVEFDPTAVGVATGTLTVTSTSSGNGTSVIALTGTGMAASYAVDLSWDAPTSSTDPVAGYNVYRSPSGSSTYQLLNSSVNTETTYVDSAVQNGQSYDYIVESVDDSGVESVPTSPIAVTVP
jgi:hypothetical protein